MAASGGGLLVLFGASSLITNRAARLAVQAVATIGSVVVFFMRAGLRPPALVALTRAAAALRATVPACASWKELV